MNTRKCGSILFSMRRLQMYAQPNHVLLSNPLFDLLHVSNRLWVRTGIQDIELKVTSQTDTHILATGPIPFRWLEMIQDFHWPESTIQSISLDAPPIFPNNTPIVLKVNNSIDRVLPGGWHTPSVVYPDDYWGTYDGSFTPYTKRILRACSLFRSTRPSIPHRDSYRPLPACEGGISIHTKTETEHDFSSRDRDIKGKQFYKSNSNVNREELTCLYLAMKSYGVNASVSEIE